MPRIGWLKSEDLPRWDRFVEAHPFGWICQTSEWQKVLENSFRHIRGNYCVIEEGEAGEIVGGLPVYEVRSWLLGNRLVSIPFATLCDPLLSSPGDGAAMLQHLIGLGNRSSARCIEIRTLKSTALHNEPRLSESHSHLHHFITLNRSKEQIFMRFGRTAVRQMITKAEKEGFEVFEGKDLSDLAAFYRLLFKTRSRLCLPPIPFRFFRCLWEILSRSDRVVLLLTRHKDTTIGAVMALNWKDTFALEYVGYDERYRKFGVVQFLYWEAIKLAMEQGRRVFSFGRTYRANKGLMESKRHWGTTEEEINTFFYSQTKHKNVEDRETFLYYRIVKHLLRILPDSGRRLVGQFCYRHMG